MPSKPQISVETTSEFSEEFSTFAETQRTKKRYLVEDALRNYMSESRGARLAVDIDVSLKARLNHASTEEGLRLEWLVVKAIDEFFKRRANGEATNIFADISSRLAKKLDVFRHIRGPADTHALLEQSIDKMIDQELRYDDNARIRFDELLGQVTKDEAN